MGPTHATKGNRRYPYYFVGPDPASRAEPVRLPALELERTVAEAVRGFLDNPLQLSEQFSAPAVRDTQRLLAAAQEKGLRLSDLASSASRMLVQAMLRRVTIREGELSIEIERSSLQTEMSGTPGIELSAKPIVLTVPIEMSGGTAGEACHRRSHSSENEATPSLIHAVAMARDWAERVVAGEVFELNQLASEYWIERSYAQKVFRCVALSPQHVEAILSGQHRAGLTFAVATANIPLLWQAQNL